jgi:hypothetical protein
MKTLLFAALSFAALTSLAPRAEAGYYERYVQYYDHCGRPVYAYVYRDDCRPGYRPAYVRTRPVYYAPRRNTCAPRSQVFISRPRLSVAFGF